MQRLFLYNKLNFRNVGRDAINSGLGKIKTGLRTVINLIDLTHIANKFETNTKISELIESKLKHILEKVIHNYSLYTLSTTEKLLCKGLNFALS